MGRGILMSRVVTHSLLREIIDAWADLNVAIREKDYDKGLPAVMKLWRILDEADLNSGLSNMIFRVDNFMRQNDWESAAMEAGALLRMIAYQLEKRYVLIRRPTLRPIRTR